MYRSISVFHFLQEPSCLIALLKASLKEKISKKLWIGNLLMLDALYNNKYKFPTALDWGPARQLQTTQLLH